MVTVSMDDIDALVLALATIGFFCQIIWFDIFDCLTKSCSCRQATFGVNTRTSITFCHIG